MADSLLGDDYRALSSPNSPNSDRDEPRRHRVANSRCSFVLLVALCFFHLTCPSAAASHSREVFSVRDATDSSHSMENLVRREGVDSSLRKYALLALSRLKNDSKTGTVYNVTLPPQLAGIQAQAIRLRSGSFKRHGLTFNEFSIPKNATVNANQTQLLMIYRSIFNFTVYSLPAQYEFWGPVVGIIIYSPSNFTSDDPALAELPLTFPNKSISIHPPLSRSLGTTAPLCAFFSANGTITFENTSSPNVCTSATLGDVALVLPTSASPSPQSPTPTPTPTPTSLDVSPSGGKGSPNWKLIVAITCIALAGVAFCIAVALICMGLAEKIKLAIVSRFSDNEEALETSLIGMGRAPAAASVRTKPALEMDLARF